MEKLNATPNKYLPYSELLKVSDILYFDGPILSHFKDLKSNNILFLWVDNTETLNRWMVWKTSDSNLYYYLKGQKSLEATLNDGLNEFVYFVDIDSKGNYEVVWSLYIDAIPDSYKLETDSFYLDRFPTDYEYLNQVADKDLYLQNLRENSIYLKLSNSNNKFKSTITCEDASTFLKGISESFINYAKYDFIDSIKKGDIETSDISRDLNSLVEEISPRIVDLSYSSFKVSISTDSLQRDTNGKYNKWKKRVLQMYQDNILNIDYKDKKEVNDIVEKFSTEQRKKIFAPLFRITQNKDLSVEIKNFKGNFIKKLSKVNTDTQRLILPKSITEEEKTKTDKSLVSIVLEVPKDKKIENLTKKDLQQSVLFSQDQPSGGFPLEVTTFIYEGVKYNIIKPIEIKVQLLEGEYHYYNSTFGFFNTVSKKELVFPSVKASIANAYNQSDENSKSLYSEYINYTEHIIE